MGHLTKETYARLLESPKNEPELYEHLKTGCDVCEAFLAEQPHALLDGVTDAALLSGAVAKAGDEGRAAATYERIRPAPSRRWVLALAAMVLVVLGAALLLRPRDDTQGLKGGPHVTLELQALVKGTDDSLTRVDPGKAVAPAGTLLFRYHASDSVEATLVIVRDGKRQEIGTVALESGTHDLSSEGSLLGLPLFGEHGRVLVRLEAVDSAAEVEVNVGP